METYLDTSSGSQLWSNGSGFYDYEFNASGDNSTGCSQYSCTISAGGTASGNYTNPSQVGSSSSSTNPWSQTTANSDTVTYNSSGSAARSGSGSTSSSFSNTYLYSYSANGGTINGTETDSGSDTTSYTYQLTYSSGSIASGTASNEVTSVRDSSYAGSGSYSDDGDDDDDDGDYWHGSGTQSESGQSHDSSDYTTYYSWSSNAWQQTSGSGSDAASGESHYSYTGSGDYDCSGSGGAGNSSASGDGTYNESGNDDSYYSSTTYYSLSSSSSGTWRATSGTGIDWGSGATHYSYTGGTDDGDFSSTKMARTIPRTPTPSTVRFPAAALERTGGSDTSSASGDSYDSCADGGSDWSINSFESDTYNDTTYYTRSSGAWQATSGTTSGSGETYDDSSFTSCPYQYSPGPGETMSGSYDQSDDDDDVYNYSTTGLLSSGVWSQSGSETDNIEGGSDYSYSGSGTYLGRVRLDP